LRSKAKARWWRGSRLAQWKTGHRNPAAPVAFSWGSAADSDRIVASVPILSFCILTVDFDFAIFGSKSTLIEMSICQKCASDGPDKVPIRTLRFKVRAESYVWLNAAAIEANQVWNYFNATSFKAARPYSGRGKWLSGFDLCNLSAGASEFFEHIGANTIQRIASEIAARRGQFKRAKLRWRVSSGSKRSLGWIPFKAASIRRRGRYLRFCGKVIRIFESERFEEIDLSRS
jgi:hypothetical protein